MMSVDVLYFIEHKARELDAACAVKYICNNQYELSVEIRSIISDLKDTLKTFIPKVVVLPYCVSIKSMYLEEIVIQWPEARYINLSYEQLLGNAQKAIKAPRDNFSRNYVIHHAWGEFFADFLLESGVPQSNVVVNGNPTYALYQDPYKQFYGHSRDELAKQFNLDPGKRWVFIPENYGWAFFKDNMLRDRIRRGFDPQQAYEYRDFSVDSMTEAGDWWCEGARLEEIELIVRPRPAVPRNTFQEVLQEMVGVLPEDLHIIKHGSVREWILASDIVISSYSTTLLEAATAHKPVFMLKPFPFPAFIHVGWNNLAEKIKTKEEFLAVISKPEIENNWIPLENWVTDKMLSTGDPIANLARILRSVLSGKIESSPPKAVAQEISGPTLDKTVRHLRKFGWDSMQNFLSLIGVKTYDHSWNPHETDLFSTEEVDARVQRWGRVLG